MINKNISVWRGDLNPPTEYHLWLNSEGKLLAKINEQWELISGDDIPLIEWETSSHLNSFTEAGQYYIFGQSNGLNGGLPILNSDSGHTFDAVLRVLDSSLTKDADLKLLCITLILSLSNRMGGDGHIFVRTIQTLEKDNLTRTNIESPTCDKWGTWEKLLGIIEKNAVTNIDDLNTYTTNGMYSGIFTSGKSKILGGLEFKPGDTFLIVTVNGYAASAFGTPQLTQMLYLLPSKKESGDFSARMYMRTAWWNVNANPKSWEWDDFDGFAKNSEVSEMFGLISAAFDGLNGRIDENTKNIASAKTAAETAQQTATDAKKTAIKANDKNTVQDGRLDKLEERVLQYLYPKIYQINEGAGARLFHGFTKDGGVGSLIKPKETYRYSILYSTKQKQFVLNVTDEASGVSVKIGTFTFWPEIILPNNKSIASSESYALRDCLYYIYVEGEGSTYYYIGSNGEATEQSATYLLRRLVDKNTSAIDTASSIANAAKETADAAQESANTAQQTADAAQTKNADQDTRIATLLQDIPWEGYHMNAFTETGEYHIHGERTDTNDGLPILNAGTIDARLTVLDSSLTNGTGEKTDIVVTQILRLSNRMGGDGHVYVRTAQAATKSQLATPSSTAWGTWEKLMGMFEKNAVTNIADLDTYTTNGMYSGLFANTAFQTLGGLQFTPGDTFLLITVNGYAASAFGTPQLTQMLYLLPSKKGSGNSSARMYLRTAYWDKNADPKAWVWANWDRLATASEISGGGGGSISKLLVSITWSELKALRDNSQLVAGTWYRITDYTCTTIQENTRSAGHIFDVIVRADSENKLNEEAFAIQHEGDDYFASSNLSAWKLWYSLDNDTTRFAWADSTNGKGVIYRMIDEWNNDIPYDFKNMQFARDWSAIAPDSGLSGTVYCYTFSIFLDDFIEDAVASDESIKAKEYLEIFGEGCFGNNTIGTYQIPYICYLNNIIFVSDFSSFALYHNSNSFGNGCNNNTFVYDCSNNSFGSECSSNSFLGGCSNNSFKNGFFSNSFLGGCSYSSFGSKCHHNNFGGGCYNSSFGSECHHNNFGNECNYNNFGNECNNNSFGSLLSFNNFGNRCSSNSFGSHCSYNSFGENCNLIKFASDSSASTKYNYYQYNHFGDNCSCIVLKGAGDASSSKQLQNYNFAQGVQGTSSNYLNIDGVRNLSYETKVAKNSTGELKIYCEADLIQ